MWSDLSYNVDVSTFSWVLTLFGTLSCTVFVHRIVISVRASDSGECCGGLEMT